MYHFTYKTIDNKGNYYLGRHSTKNLFDGYQGSGNWVKSSRKKGKHLITGIVEFYNTFEELKHAEESLIFYHKILLEDKKCKNQLLSSSGFACGENNPAKSEKERKRRREVGGWWSTEEGKQFTRENHWSKFEEKLEHVSFLAKKQWEDEDYKEYMRSIVIEYNNTPQAKKRMYENNPAKSEDARKKLSIKSSKRQREMVENGTHNFLKPGHRERCSKLGKLIMTTKNPMKNPESVAKVTKPTKCPVCGKVGAKRSMTRYHFSNCKYNPSFSYKINNIELLIQNGIFSTKSKIFVRKIKYIKCL